MDPSTKAPSKITKSRAKASSNEITAKNTKDNGTITKRRAKGRSGIRMAENTPGPLKTI
jgi:hypothetical protein